MSDFESEEAKVASWLEPLPDESAPCGPDLEYDNDFLAITQAAAGKPESQFGAAEPPNWREVADMGEALLDRSRDLRIALLWLRAKLHLMGYGALPVGLQLINGLLTQLGEHVHPQPDPDDGDPYARVNALTFMRENDGLISDLRESTLVRDRAIGELTLRTVSVALGQMAAADDETPPSKDVISRMLGDAVAKSPELRTQCEAAVTQVRSLISIANEMLGDAAPDLRPLYTLVNGVASLLPAEGGAGDGAAGEDVGDGGAAVQGQGGGGASGRSLSGAVNSREDAIRAIDLVCDYLERAEPTNPAPLFLRRARQLVGQNFLQLIKALAPEALAGVAGMVGVDPESIDGTDASSSDGY
jgi:type VI secretion system protein ImpA